MILIGALPPGFVSKCGWEGDRMELGWLLRKMGFGLFISCELRQSRKSRVWCVSEAHVLAISASQPLCPGLGISLCGLFAKAAITPVPQRERKTQPLMIMAYPLLPSQESSICVVGWHPYQASDGLSIQRRSPLWQPLGSTQSPLAKQDAMFPSTVSSSCLSTVVSEAGRKCSSDLPSLHVWKPWPYFALWRRQTEEF